MESPLNLINTSRVYQRKPDELPAPHIGITQYIPTTTIKFKRAFFRRKMLASTIVLITGFFLTGCVHSQSMSSNAQTQKIFVEKSYEKISQNANDDELTKTFDNYSQKPDAKNFARYEKRATEVSLMRDIKVNITVTTLKEGALVKYKPLDDSEPFTGSEPTNKCLLKLPLGYSIIWTERNGKRTSADRKISVVDDETVFIEETQTP